jgi:hypothetical protein
MSSLVAAHVGRVSERGEMRCARSIVGFLGAVIIAACGDGSAALDPPVYQMTIDARLLPNADGLYELTLNRHTTQTIHRISGHVTVNGQPLENQRVIWESSHSWIIADTLAFIIRRECPFPESSDIDCIWVINTDGSTRDTVYHTQFEGMEVPTVNSVAISSSSGEINTVFAPVWWMAGDTVTVTATALFPTADERDSVQIVLQ